MKTESQKLRAQIRKTKWDGKDRLRGIARRVFGTSGRQSSRNIRLMLTQIVGRVMKPGFKADQMVVLVGGQGCGKSIALHALGGDGYQASSMLSNDDIQEAHRYALIEISVTEHLNQNPAQFKRMMTSNIDRFRDPYAKTPTDHPRAFAIVGTSNVGPDPNYVYRRVLWTPVGNINTDYLERYRLQIFAQVHRYMRNGAW